MNSSSPIPDFQQVVMSGIGLQKVLAEIRSRINPAHDTGTPCAVGGTAASLHCRHRYSLDVDHILPNLRDQFDQIREELEKHPEWKTARTQGNVLLLGSWNGIENGLRQVQNQKRLKPFETETVDGLLILSPSEALRTKAWMLATRHAVRDFMDVAALADHLGHPQAVSILKDLNLYYRDTTETSPLQNFIEACQTPPSDWHQFQKEELSTYKGIIPPYDQPEYLKQVCRSLAADLVMHLPEPQNDPNDPFKI